MFSSFSPTINSPTEITNMFLSVFIEPCLTAPVLKRTIFRVERLRGWWCWLIPVTSDQWSRVWSQCWDQCCQSRCQLHTLYHGDTLLQWQLLASTTLNFISSENNGKSILSSHPHPSLLQWTLQVRFHVCFTIFPSLELFIWYPKVYWL